MPLSRDPSVTRVYIPKAYVRLPSFYRSHFYGQDGTSHVITASLPYFYAINPEWYDGYEYNSIPVKAAYLVIIGNIGKEMHFPSAIIADINKVREHIMRKRFCRPARPPKMSERPTVPFQLTLPIVTKDAPFHPTTFSHSLWDLGDVLKILFLVAIRDGVPYSQFMPQVVPSLHFISLYSDNYLSTRGKHHFTQVVTGQPFRLIKKCDMLAYIQHSLPDPLLPPTVWPSMQPLYANKSLVILHKMEGVIDASVGIVAQIAEFTPIYQQGPCCEEVLERSAERAKEIQLEVQIPEGTPNEYRVAFALAALRRMEIPAKNLPSLLQTGSDVASHD